MDIHSTPIAESLYAFGYTMLAADRIATARETFRAMVLFFPTDERGWLGLARTHEEEGQDDVARELYSFCLLVVPGAIRARFALADVLERTGAAEHVAELVTRARELAAEAA